MLMNLLFRDKAAPQNTGRKRISPESVTSTSPVCPHAPTTSIDELVKSVGVHRSIILRQNILANSPIVRMFFRTGEGHERTPMVAGHMIRAHVVEIDGMNDMFEVTIRINAEQAANLPFVEVYDA